MDILLVLLRLIHILAAVAWVGVGTAQILLIMPALSAAGEGSVRFLKAMNALPISRSFFPVAGGITMLAGILLYITGSASHFSQVGNMVLGTGALAGIAAGIHGGAITGRATAALAAAVGQYGDAAKISAEGQAVIQQRIAELTSHVRVSYVLMIIALVGMGSARYL
jgi:hypothetical protein